MSAYAIAIERGPLTPYQQGCREVEALEASSLQRGQLAFRSFSSHLEGKGVAAALPTSIEYISLRLFGEKNKTGFRAPAAVSSIAELPRILLVLVLLRFLVARIDRLIA